MSNIIVFGTGSAAREFLSENTTYSILFFVDNNPIKWGDYFFGFPVKDPSILSDYIGKAKVLIASAYIPEITEQLEGLGFDIARDLISKPKQNFYYLNNKNDIQPFFEEIKQANIRYVVLRHYSSLPEECDGDIDLLVHDIDIKLFENTRLRPSHDSEYTKNSDIYSDAIKVDIYSACGTAGYRHNNISLFKPSDAFDIIDNRILFKNLIFVPSPEDYNWSYLYYVCYIKYKDSAIPLTNVSSTKKLSVFKPSPSGQNNTKISNKYEANVKNILCKSDDECISLSNIHSHLESLQRAPNFSLLRRLIGDESMCKSLSLNQLSNSIYSFFLSNQKTKGLYIYFIRERAIKLNALSLITSFVESSDLNLLFTLELDSYSKFSLASDTRGGNWYDNFGAVTNGYPHTLIFLQDQKLTPIGTHAHTMNLRLAKYESYFLKDKLREHLDKLFPHQSDLNLFHTTDDEYEVAETIHCLSPSLREKTIETLSKLLSTS